MNENDDLLSFLVEGLVGPQRDLVTRAFYKYAEGDPNSGPVNEAVLLTACSRRLALAPKELREANAEFRKLLAEGRDMEARIRERVERSNAGVVASFKDEATRACSNLQTTAQYHERILFHGLQITGNAEKVLDEIKPLLTELLLIKIELKTNSGYAKKIVEATEGTKASSQTIKEIVSNLTNMAEVNWLTIGVGIGFVLTVIATQLSWWGALLLFAVAIGLLQAAAQSCRSSVTKLAGTVETTGQAKK